ncbi:MCE family protein [Euzebya sp.]|uniref:MCE family protein n=1 Tax=Euzebya sp. TaxID=1971409 RepID=UPI003517D428
MKQFIERNQIVIGVITAVLIVVTIVASLSVTRQDIGGGYTISASFADANGLQAGDVVLVAGIRAGTVTAIDIGDDHVEAEMQVDGGIELPSTTRAEITLRTLVGKRGVILDTGNDFEGELLVEGDHIPIERTTVTTDVPELAETADDLLGEIDSDALNMLLVNVADVTRGQRERVADLVDSGTDLTELVNSQETQIRELLRNLSTVSQTLESRDDELIGIIDDLDVALGNLAARRADLQALLAETQRTGAVTADFVVGVREDLDAILDELHLDLEIVSRHQVDLAEGLAYAGDSLIGFSSIGFANGQPVPWGHVFVNAAGPANVDLLVGCGGILDQQLDVLLGPDPRSCEEQTNQTLPDDSPNPEEGDDGPIPGLPDLPILTGDGPIHREPQRLPIDVGPRSLIDALTGGAADEGGEG